MELNIPTQENEAHFLSYFMSGEILYITTACLYVDRPHKLYEGYLIIYKRFFYTKPTSIQAE